MQKKIEYILLIIFPMLLAGCSEEVSRSPVEPPPPEGFIYVNSIPNGFTIFQNGRNTGRITPDSISFIDKGDYAITLKKKYFKDTTVVVNLPKDQKISLNIDVTSNPSMYGQLNLQSTPSGASIYINDSLLTQVAPVALNGLLPGEYRVRFSLYNHRDEEIIAVVRSSDVSNYNESLRDTSQWVDFGTSNSGLQSNSLTAINVDNNNIKWIGSADKGLIRFNEIEFLHYSRSNSQIPSDNVRCISIDHQNNVWVGTEAGIGIFNGSSWIIYNQSNSGLTTNLINTIRFDSFGNAWIGTSGNLVKFDGVNWSVYEEPQGRDWVQDLFIESENKIWLGTRTDGIFTFENNSFISFLKPQYNYPTYSISSMASDMNGNIWYCFLNDTSGRGGVSYWDGDVFTNYTFGSAINSSRHIFIDQENEKWVSTSEGFVHFNSSNSFETFTTSNSLINTNLISASVRDQSGNIWIATSFGGLNKLKWSPP